MVGVSVMVGVLVMVGVGVRVGVWLGVKVGVTVGLFVAVPVGVTVGVSVMVAVQVGVSVGLLGVLGEFELPQDQVKGIRTAPNAKTRNKACFFTVTTGDRGIE
jgi:predicted anti-sigma-YlaC factor YlaD